APPYETYIQWLKKRNTIEARQYWKNTLAGYESVTGIPTDRLAEEEATKKMEEILFTFPHELTHRLNQFTQAHQITLNTLLQTLWGILLQKYNHTNDVVFGTVVSGRPSEIQDIGQMIGLFINTVPIRVQRNAGETFLELLKRVQQMILDADTYHYVSLAEIQADLGLRSSFLDHLLVFENF